MDLQSWLMNLAEEIGGFYDEEMNLCVDPGDGLGANSYSAKDVRLLYQSHVSPREAADFLRNGGQG